MGATVLDPVKELPIVFRRTELRGSEETLDGLFVRAWEGLSACHTVACPACGGAMAPRRTTGAAGGALVRRGQCGSCAAELF